MVRSIFNEQDDFLFKIMLPCGNFKRKLVSRIIGLLYSFVSSFVASIANDITL